MMSDKAKKETKWRKDAKRHPIELANVASRLIFAWFDGLVRLGYQRAIEFEDIPNVAETDTCGSVEARWGPQFEQEFRSGNEKPSLFKALRKTFGKRFMLAGIAKIAHDWLLFLGPMVLNLFITHIASIRANDPDEQVSFGYILALLLLIGPLVQSVVIHVYFHHTIGVGMNMRSALVTSIYKKALRITEDSKRSATTGKLVNLMFNDANRIQMTMMNLHLVWSAPLQIIITLVLLFQMLGVACLAGVGIMVLMLPINGFVSQKLVSTRKTLLEATDKRVSRMTEILGGIKVVKLYAWEKEFMNVVGTVRESEAKILKKVAILRTALTFIFSCTPVLVAVSSLAAYALIDSNDRLTAAKAFTALSLFQVLGFPLAFIPMILSAVVDARVALLRIQDFFKLPVLPERKDLEGSTLGDAYDTEMLGIVGKASFGYDKKSAKEMAKSKKELWRELKRKERETLGQGDAPLPEMSTSSSSETSSEADGVDTANRTELDDVEIMFTMEANTEEGEKVAAEITEKKEKHETPLVPARKSKDVGARVRSTSIAARILRGSIAAVSGTTANIPERKETFGHLYVEDYKAVLKELDFSIKKGVLCGVVGRVGAGKSTLLAGLLGEIEPLGTNGAQEPKVFCRGSIAYAPQEAWILNTTVRNNILFGREYDEDLYERVLYACCLDGDLEQLPAGEMTEIGERGVTLSGGQKQRISLARACYADADVYIMDDPLSAVDAHVGEHLFRECVCGFLKDKTRILVTHHVNFLKSSHVDNILVLGKARILHEGSYAELEAQGVALEGHTVTVVKTEEEEEEKKKAVAKPKEIVATPKGEAHHKIEHHKKGDAGKTMTVEEREKGAVKGSVFLFYFRATGLAAVVFPIVLAGFALGGHAFRYLSNFWVAQWSQDVNEEETLNYWLGGYVLLGFSSAFAFLLSGIFIAFSRQAASRNIHDGLMLQILRAPMSFFDTTPMGRILNRFSKDMDAVDTKIPDTLMSFASTIGVVVVTLSTIFLVVPFFFIPLIFIGIVYRWVQKLFRSTARELKRLDAVSRSPIYAHFSETLDGLAVIRATGSQERFSKENEELVDRNNSLYFLLVSGNRWLGVRLESIGAFVGFSTAIILAAQAKTMDPGLAGLALSTALGVSGWLGWLVRMIAETENDMNSVERIEEYSHIKSEGSGSIDIDVKNKSLAKQIAKRGPNTSLVELQSVPESWPSKGRVVAKNLHARYRTDLPLVLKGVDFVVEGGQKVGICGRTGSGKSSLVTILFRMIEPEPGSLVEIDGVNIENIGLSALRSRLTIIPQDPFLFAGTARYNLDPFSLHTDAELWWALERVSLKPAIEAMEGGLSAKFAESGSNLSVGQRQLVCLARALLRRPKILVMDEATAAVDFKTDNIIQETVRKEFKDATIFTIAHRLSTILDYDKVMVLDDGKMAEFDSPAKLAGTDSIFAELLAAAEAQQE